MNRLRKLNFQISLWMNCYTFNTCNRLRSFYQRQRSIDNKFLKELFLFINPNFSKELINLHLSKALVLSVQMP